MSASKKTALASLTATYSDSDVDNEETYMDIDSATETTPEPVEVPQPIVEVNRRATKAKLVSYHVEKDEKATSDNQSDLSDLDISTDDEITDDEIPEEPRGRCAPELIEKMTALMERVKSGVDMNKFIQERKSFRNPSIYEKLIEYCDLNEYGTNFPTELYNPFEFGKDSYYDELAKVQKAEMEKREKERKERTKVEIMSGTAKHITNTNAGANVAVTNVTRNSLDAADASKRRKTKWDQVAASVNPSTVIATASGTKGTVIPAFGELPKKPKV